MAKSYRDYEIWQMAHELAVRVHKMTLEKLPRFEMYEEASQSFLTITSIQHQAASITCQKIRR